MLDLPITTFIAATFAFLTLIKIVTLLVNKQKWYHGVAEKIFAKPKLNTWIFGILSVLVFYYLLQELTILQIFASIGLAALLIGTGMMGYAQELKSFMKKAYNKPFSIWQKIYFVIWIALSLWVLTATFA